MTKIQRLSLTFIMVLIATVTWAHKIKVNNTGGNPTITVKNGDTTVGETTDVLAGSTITLTVADNDSKYISSIEIQAFAGAGSASAPRRAIEILGPISVRTVTEYKVYEFTMPNYDVEITPTFADRISISTATITLAETNRVFDWLSHTPIINSVTLNGGATILVNGTDYTVTGIDSYTNAGSYTITVTGEGKYKGTKTATYTINPLALNVDPVATVQLSQTSYIYNKGVQKPIISGVYKKGQTLVEETDYTSVAYSNSSSTAVGDYTISVTGTGNFSGTVSGTYSITGKPISSADITVSLAPTSFTYNGTVRKPEVSIMDGETTLTLNTDYTLTWSDENSKDINAYTVTVNGKGNYIGSVTKTYTITASNTGVAIAAIADQTYTGAEIKPAITVTKDGNPLNSEYYSIVYSNNINVGTATITILGQQSYSFMETQTFKIVPKDISTNGVVNLSATSFTYNGTTQKPTVTSVTDVISSGGSGTTTVTLVENKDYILENAGGVNKGTYNVTVTGRGNYTGSKTAQFTISELSYSNTNTTITLGTSNFVYDGTEKTPEVIQVKVGDVIVPATDYTIGYSNNTAAGTATVTINKRNIAISGELYNLDGSASTTFTITPKPVSDLTVTLNTTTFTYNGSVQKPTVTVKDGSTTLTENTDYSLTWAGGDYTAVGSYTVTVTGIGNYAGEVNKTYVINYGTSDSDFTVTVSGTYTYNGAAYTPAGSNVDVTDGSQAVVVKNGTTILTPTTDYTLSYSNNINAGTATVTATGKGNYQFVQTGTFTIDPKPLTVTMVTFIPNTFVYNGAVQKPTVTVTDDTKTLVEGTDYTLTNNGATNVSTGNTVTIVGMGNYTGTLDSNTASMPTYSITALDISSGSGNTVTITLYPLADATYSGIAKEPMVQQVKVNDIVFTSGYSVSYENNKDVGNSTTQPTVKVTGSGNLTGDATTTFVINPKPLTDDMVVLAYTSVAYDGTPKEPSVTVTDAALPTADKTVPASNYDVTYTTDHTTPGDKTATITGKNNYTGTISKPYTIVGASDVTIEWEDADAVAAYVYDGTAKEPAVTVKKGTATLTLNTDYTVSWSNNVNAGTNTAYITVTGKGNYDFTQTKTFSIAKKEMTNDMVTLGGGPFTYNGNIQKPTITVSDGTLMTANDYTISNDGNINAGDYTVTVTATSGGNYSGSGSQSYTINPLSIASGEVNLSYINTVFNGSVQKPSVQTVYTSGHQLTATTDYTISWPGSDYTNQGVKTVTVTGTGNYKDSKSVTYTIEQKEVTSSMIKIANENLTYTGSHQTASVTIEDNIGNTNIITANDYTLTNEGGTEVGNYTVSIVGKGNYKGSASKQYSIVTAGSTGFTVEDIPAQTYTGLPLTPTVTVKKAGTEDGLTEYTDYTLAWTNNINAGANTASVTVTGMGNYSGTQTVYFTITPKSLTDATITATLSPTSFDYTGSTQKPTVTVKDGTAKTLVLNTDYTLVNDGGTAQGTYNVTITGIGNYTGVLTPSYSIGKQSLTGAVVVLNQLDSYVYDGNPKTPGVSEVKVGSVVIPASNYDVAYSDNVNAGTATVTVTGKGNCDGSATATFTITPKMVNSDMITISPTTFNYDGALHKPTTVTVKDGTKVMVKGTTAAPQDYLLTNEGGTDIGTYSVTITGQGNYTGTASKSYSIVANDASGFTIDAIADLTYDGTAKTPAPVVKEGETTLSSNYYSVAYLNNINAGTAVVTVTGKNGYTFVKSQTFTIQPKTLVPDMVALSATDFTYNGNIQKPTITVTDNNTSNESIITSNDYIVTNEGGANVGTYHVVVNGQNNYTGSVDKTFTIGQLSLSTATITLATLSSYVYDGTAKTPAVQLVKVGELVVPATTYDVAYTSNTNVGTAMVTVTAKTGSNFKDGNSTTFNIEQKEVNSNMITLGGTGFNTTTNSFTFDGAAHVPTVTVADGTMAMTLDTDYTLVNVGGTAVGNYTVTITGKGNYKGSASKQYSIVTAGSTGFTVDAISAQTYTGLPLTPTVVVKKANTTDKLIENTDYTLAWTNNTNAGEHTASVTVTGMGNYSGTQTVYFTINPKALNADETTLSATSYDYNGMEQKPAVTVKDGGTTLVKDKDYTLTYPVDAVNQGTKTITVKGIGNYASLFDKTYTIHPLSLNNASTSIMLSANSYVFDHAAKTPDILLVKVGDLVIPNTGYSVAYSDNTNAGTATVTLTGSGNYKDAKTTTFTITKRTITSEMVKLNTNNFVYNGSVQQPVVQVVSGYTITDDDVTITYPSSKDVGVYDVTVTGKAPNNQGTVNLSYSISSNNQSDVVVTLAATDNLTYTGNAVTRNITVKKGENTLTEGTDYTVVYNNNINKGTATVNVIGKNGYDFVETKTFEITARPLSATGISMELSSASFVYNGATQKPDVMVKYTYTKTGDTSPTTVTLVEGTDYRLTNNGTINVSTGNTATIEGIGNFQETISSPTYAITALDISGATITLYPLADATYSGSAKEPAIQRVTVGTLVLTAGYSTAYENNVNVETATIKPTVKISDNGAGNLTGIASTTFVINPKPLASDMVVLAYTSVAYDGTAKEPAVTVTDVALPFADKVLTLGTDYTVSYTTDHTTPGDKTATITGKGNYTGTISKPYTIVGASGVDIALSDPTATFTYNGSAHTPAVTVTKGSGASKVTLAYGTDYSVAYSDNIHAGTATITVTGKGNYDFTQTKTFSIAKKEMTNDMVILSSTSFTYNWTTQKPMVTVSDGTPSIITTDDYTISNDGNINVGDYTVTVTATATGNYSGSGSQAYTINPLSVSNSEIHLSYLNTVFNGSVQKPNVQTVYTSGHQLTATTDYTISWPETDYTNQGVKTITVTGTGNYKDSKSVTYTIAQKEVTNSMIKIANENLTYTGAPQAAVVSIEDMVGGNNIITTNDYTLTNPNHTDVGNYEVQIVGKGNYKGTATKQYSIVTAGTTGFTVDVIPAQTYTGLTLTPTVTVKKANTTDVLIENTDYTLAWTNNTNAGEHTASVTVTGMGNYSGTQTVYFTITPKSLTDATITATLSPTSFDYTGITQKPTVTVKDGTAKTLMQNTDYTLVNDGGTAQGTYNVTITGIGNYKDVLTPSYTIGAQSLDNATIVLNRLDSYVYDGNPKHPGVSEVKVGATVIPASNYDVSYGANTNAGAATVTVTGKNSCTGSATATFTITPKTVNSDMITISPTTFNYDGQLHKPTTVTVKDGTRDMTLSTDYTLTNEGATEIGGHSVTITGIGNYTGTASKSYNIVANDASSFSINAIDDVTYDGTEKTPTPVVMDGTNTLDASYYSVAYLNNINAGTAVVTVTGKNGYTFVKSQTFKIKPRALAADMVTLSATDFTYNGNVLKPTVTVKDLVASVSIITSNDYVVTNEGGTDIGTYHVVVNGQNNYTGTIDKTFTVSKLSLSTATITLATLPSYVYDGAAKTPAVQLVKVGELVVPATVCEVAYASNTNVGTATVTVTAKEGTNFKDGNTTTFNIEQKTVTSDMIYLSSENLEYTGSTIKPEVTVKDGSKTLALTTDYTLANEGGIAVGNYEVSITGQGNYTGTAKKQYSIITQGATGFKVEELTGTYTYSGSPLTPAVTVKKAGTTTTLIQGTDYEVVYTDNINVGTATATVTGKGNYSGTRSVNFTISPKPLTDGMVALSATSFTYSGAEQKPVVSVTDTDINMPLTQGTQFTVTYPTDAISQGTKAITIRGIGNYTGEITKDYTIGMLSLTDASVTLNELTNFIYDGIEKKPTVKEVLVGTLVVPTTGYTVTYPDDVINVGTKTITIAGKGNYTGSTTKSYIITPKSVTREMISLSNENLIYTGSTIKPTVTVKDGSKTLIQGTDYTLSNEGGIEVGTYSLTITGIGNYTGTASRTFNIITKGASVFSVSNIASVTYNGSEQEPEITVVDNSTAPATTLTKGTHYTVAYSNNKNVGTASVTVTGIGSYAGTVSKNFTITPKTLTGDMVTLSATTFLFNGMAQKPEVTVDDKNAANVSIISDNDYTILNNGGINVGDDHEVKVTAKGNYTGTVIKAYTITPLSIANANVTLYQLPSYVYDGTAKKPGVREVMAGDITVPTTGYEVSYGENINVGTARVTLTGKGNFKDAQTVEFTITGRPITSDMIVLSSENLVYNGEVQKPSVTVKDGAKTLTIGSDYTLTNEGGTSVGSYSVTVAGKGNYASEAFRTYSIVEKDGPTNFTISLSNTSVQYNGSEQKPAVTVTDGTKTLTNNTDYEVSYTDNVNVGTATVMVTGKGNYAGTKTTTFTITAKPLTETMVTLSVTSFVYNTNLQKPEVVVSDGNIMTKDDYVVTNNGGTNQGTYHVIVNGQGNYSGQIDKTFTITPLSIADAMVTLYQLQSYIYEGMQKKPGVREVAVGSIIVPTQGYTTTYGDNMNAGTATVTVTGQGNYKDTKTVTFDIEQKPVENSMIVLSNYEYTYNGDIQKPEVIVRDGETTLLLDTDYTLLNNGGKTVGPYDVTIAGKGNYKGTASKTYIINAKEVGSFEVTLSTESVTYNGSEQQPEVTVKDGETVLTKGVHYTVSYTDNVNVGMATVTVRGQGQYEGSRNKTFLIQPKSLSDDMVSLNTTTFTYNGLLQMPAVTVADGTALTSNDYYITNEGGLDKGTYNVMVTGRNNYTGTIVRQYIINPMSINDGHVTLYQLQSYVYDGTAKNPGVREVAIGSHIVPSTSFNTTISPNINVGTVTVTVTGEKNYTGSTSTTFEITPKPVTSGMITLTPDYFYYNGSVQKPGVTVKDGQKNMVENTDYTVTNEGGKEAGTYEVKVKGIGNYTDEATQSFTILSSGVNTFVVTLEANEYTYDGTAHKPGVTVTMEGRTLTEGTDYTLTYGNNVNAGTATVTVKGVGDYTGEQVKTFLIQPKTLTEAMVTLDKTSFIYNENVQKPEVTVADGTLMTANDYMVTNDGGTTEGTYQVVVTGQNNYKGVVIKSFTITREDIHGDDDPQHPDENPITYTPTEEGSDEVKVSGFEGTETELSQVTSVTIPATFTSDGKTYNVVGIAANAFANVPNLTDIYMPDTEEPLVVAEGAIPASVTVHTTLALLDDYALMPSLSESFKAGKIKTTVTAKNRYWTFSSGVDVYVPDGVSVYIARERSSATVTIVELSDNDLTVGGQRIIKHNNGVLISSEGNDTPYDLVACGRRMSSGSSISTDDFKDYGSQNCLVPVIQPTHFGAGYYFLKNNEFYSIQEESEDIKVPAGKAVLYLQQAASSPSYSPIIQLINSGEVTNINGIENDTDEGDWYDMSGRKLDRRPTKKGVYIKNNKKIVIR